MKPRGLRNNNPLNIRHGQSKWKGRSEEQNDRELEPLYEQWEKLAEEAEA